MSYSFNRLSEFRFFAQKALPLVYDDSLSYYEVLCKVVKKLNDLTEVVNSHSEAIEALETELNNLETTVSGYDTRIQACETFILKFLGGTTGQVLAKASDDDNDFEWVDPELGVVAPTYMQSIFAPFTIGDDYEIGWYAPSVSNQNSRDCIVITDHTNNRVSFVAPTELDVMKVPVWDTNGVLLYANYRPVPNVTTEGYVLTVNGSGGYEWKAVSGVIPNGGTTGQVLMKASNDDGDVEWGDVESGGSTVVFNSNSYINDSYSISGSVVLDSEGYGSVSITGLSYEKNISLPNNSFDVFGHAVITINDGDSEGTYYVPLTKIVDSNSITHLLVSGFTAPLISSPTNPEWYIEFFNADRKINSQETAQGVNLKVHIPNYANSTLTITLTGIHVYYKYLTISN